MSGTTTQVGIVEWADRIESARALELQLAAVVGAWVPRIAPAGAKLLLARHARHFAWHAELWDGLVPVLHDRPEGSAVVDASLRSAQDALTAATEPKAVYDDVLPVVVAAYRSWSAESTPIAERPIMRVLDLVLNDIDFDSQEGHDLFARN
jgi:hypothetical protein